MKILPISVFTGTLLYCAYGQAQNWQNECVGYYQLQLPDNLEVALYPVRDFTHPRPQPESDGDIQVRRYATPGITFDQTYYPDKKGAYQAHFSAFYYGGYELDISTQSQQPVDFPAYKQAVTKDLNFEINRARQYEKRSVTLFKNPPIPEAEFSRRYHYLFRDYPRAFVAYKSLTYVIYLTDDQRLYHFWHRYEKEANDPSQNAETQLQKSEPQVLSLLSRFRPRKLYELPAGPGFCLPYGFIASDSGHEPHHMAVTYRLKDHPGVTIMFQDLGMKSRQFDNDNLNEKDYIDWLWNVRYMPAADDLKPLGMKWRTINMDGRKGTGSFVKAFYQYSGTYYGYVAYVQGDRSARNITPDLLLSVQQNHDGISPDSLMSKDELEKMAKHIVSSVRKR